MSPCPGQNGVVVSQREAILGIHTKLMANGREKYAVESMSKQRLAICLHASDCGRLCVRLVKALGIDEVYCVDPDKLTKVRLYAETERPEAECLLGRW